MTLEVWPGTHCVANTDDANAHEGLRRAQDGSLSSFLHSLARLELVYLATAKIETSVPPPHST